MVNKEYLIHSNAIWTLHKDNETKQVKWPAAEERWTQQLTSTTHKNLSYVLIAWKSYLFFLQL